MTSLKTTVASAKARSEPAKASIAAARTRGVMDPNIQTRNEANVHLKEVARPAWSVSPLGGPRLWRSPAAARPRKMRRKTSTRGEMSWLLRLGFATAAVRCRPDPGATSRLRRSASRPGLAADAHGEERSNRFH